MITLVLLGAGVVLLVGAGGILFVQSLSLKKGTIVREESYNGPEQVYTTVLTVIRYVLKRSIHVRKFCTQYILHFMVRVMYYFDIFTTKMYAKSRNWFVRNAVQNKGTVPHFWEHLKVYKQEMDQEREDKESAK